MLKQQDGTWKVLIGLTAVSISLACALIIFEGLFVSITFAWPDEINVCRIGTGIWAGSISAISLSILLALLCRRKNDFTSPHAVFSCVSVCLLAILADCALIVLESLCLVIDTKSPLPIFLLSVGALSMFCSIFETALLYFFWKSSKMEEKERDLKNFEQCRKIIIPNILPSYPSFVSVELN